MSDPVTNVEIEDVLSSIRRLVSEETRKTVVRPEADSAPQPTVSQAPPTQLKPRPQKQPQPDPEPEIQPELQTAPAEPTPIEPVEPPVAGTDRLVLTPALRVKDPDEGPEALGIPPEVEEAPMIVEAEPEEVDAADVVTSLAPAIEPEPAETDPEDEETAEPVVNHTAALKTALATEGVKEALEEDGDDPVSPPDVAELPMQNAPLQPDADVTPPASAQEAISTLTTKLAELEAKIGRKLMQAEAAEARPQSPDWQDQITPSPERAESEADAALRAAEELNRDFGAEEAILDEETLRELVADIVREELQGALGERITRNVRKLVRREIHRALTAQDFN